MREDFEPRWSLRRSIDRITELLDANVIGRYASAEVTELISFTRGTAPRNVVTVIVLESRSVAPDPHSPFLTRDPFSIPADPACRFGLMRRQISIEHLLTVLNRYEREQVWQPADEPLDVGQLNAELPFFAPSGGTRPAPVNALLKNNFWNGSHVFELALADKHAWGFLTSDPIHLQQLSAKVREHLPWELAGVSDFLGNVLIQVPVTSVVVVESAAPTRGESIDVTLTWHPSAMPRRLRALAEVRDDGMLLGTACSEPFDDHARLDVRPRLGQFSTSVWDEETGTTLASTAPVSLMLRASMAMSIIDDEPRTFTTIEHGGAPVPAQVSMRSAGQERRAVGEPVPARDEWRRRRITMGEADKLAESREFKQYRPSGDKVADQAMALDDLRFLIDRYGAGGVWLWDPYLSATDLLRTVFFCPYADVDLRALTSLKTPDDDSRATLKVEYAQLLDTSAGNKRGLQLEFRARYGEPGWAFHDRFLIFPRAGSGPRAWSLGTSVNSIGHEHHILQLASNSALIASAFEELWDLLTGRDQLVWRSS